MIPNVSIIPSNVNLAAAEIELIGIEEKEFIIKKEIEFIKATNKIGKGCNR